MCVTSLLTLLMTRVAVEIVIALTFIIAIKEFYMLLHFGICDILRTYKLRIILSSLYMTVDIVSALSM